MNRQRILIGLCTYRRPLVRSTIESLTRLTIPENIEVGLLIADNDATTSGHDVVAAAALDLPFDWKYIHAPAHNISVARNAVLSGAREAQADLLAFLDDDERVPSNWLLALLDRQRASGSLATVGPVRAEYLSDAPAWMVEAAIHDTTPDVSHGFAHTGYTCNMLIDLKNDIVAGLWFDTALGQSGGEDTDFFARYMGRGGRIAYAPDAELHETVPANRARLAWLLKRRFRMGQTHGAIVCTGRGPGGRFAQAGLAAGKAPACAAMAIAGMASATRRNQSLLRGALHTGVVSACFGKAPIPIYRADNGLPSAQGGVSK